MSVASPAPALSSDAELARDALAATANHAALARLLGDTVACAVGAGRIGGEALNAVARYADDDAGDPSATIWATGDRAGVRAAALCNGVAARYLDLNDTYVARAIVHPSDLWAVLVAEAEAGGRSWDELLDAAATGYAVLCQAADGAQLGANGFEASSLVAPAAALAVARLLRLTAEQAGHALAIAALDAASLRVARAGRLSHWKAISAAWAALKGASAAHAAAAGVQGPEAALTDGDGFFARISGPWSVAPGGADRVLSRVIVKRYPVQIFVQRPVDLAIAVAAELAGEPPERVTVTTFGQAVRMAGRPAEPGMNAETADHSIAFAVAAALVSGGLAPGDVHRLLGDDAVMALADRIDVRESAELSARYPGELGAALEVRTASGRTLRRASADGAPPADAEGDDGAVRRKLVALTGDAAIAWPMRLAGSPPPAPGDRPDARHRPDPNDQPAKETR